MERKKDMEKDKTKRLDKMNYHIFTDEERKARQELVSQVRANLSCADVGARIYGFNFFKSRKGARYLKIAEHGSMVFDLKENIVFWNARTRRPLNPIDFIAEYEGISAAEAVNKAIDFYQKMDYQNMERFVYDEEKDKAYTIEGMYLPNKDNNNERVIQYLCNERGLSEDLINTLIDCGMIYQDIHRNAVFVGYDEKNEPSFGFRRGTERNFQRDCAGSYKLSGYFIDDDTDKLLIAESVIDGLSYKTLHPTEKVKLLCCSGAGTMINTFYHNLYVRKNVFKNIKTIILGTDHDKAGKRAKEEFNLWINEYNKRNPESPFKVEDAVFIGKDINEELMRKKNIENKMSKEKENEQNLTINSINEKEMEL